MKGRLTAIVVLVQVLATAALLAAYLFVWRAPPGQEMAATGVTETGPAPGPFSATPPPSQAMYRGNPGRTGFYDSAEIQAIHGVKWQQETVSGSTTTPVVEGNTAYYATRIMNGGVFGRDTATGRPVYDFPAPDPGGFVSTISGDAGPAVVGGMVYYGRDSLLAFDTSGNLKWSYPLGTDTTLLASDGTVFFTNKQNVYGLDAASGSLKWSNATDENSLTAPAYGEGILYLGGGGSFDDRATHLFYAIDGQTGREVWRVSLPAPVSAPPAVADGVVYFTTTRIVRSGGGDPRFPSSDTVTGTLHAVDARTGAELWKFDTAAVLDKPVAVAGSLVFLANVSEPAAAPTDHTGYVRALDAKTGAVRWELGTGTPRTPPSVAGSLVYLLALEQGSPVLLALDAAAGTRKWGYPVNDANLNGDLTIYNGVIYLAGSSLHALY